MSIKELASKYKNLMETKKKVKKAYKVAVEMMINKVVLKHINELMEVMNALYMLRDVIERTITYDVFVDGLVWFEDAKIKRLGRAFYVTIGWIDDKHYGIYFEIGFDVKVNITQKGNEYKVTTIVHLGNNYLLNLEDGIERIITEIIDKAKMVLAKRINKLAENDKVFVDVLYNEVKRYIPDVAVEVV